MSYKIAPPQRAEHLGSLLRPKVLLEARAKNLPESELEPIADKAIRDAVAMQQELGFKSISDGEFRRHMFYDGFFDVLDGMEYCAEPSRDIFRTYVPDIAAFIPKDTNKTPAATFLCTSKLKHKGTSIYQKQFDFVKTLIPEKDWKNIKMTLAAPEWFHLRHGSDAYTKDAYDTDAEYFADIAKAYQTELDILYKAGCRNVQIDDPLLAYFCAQSMLDGMKAANESVEELLDAYIKLYQDCLATRKDDMAVALHICRGNYKGSIHFSEGGYEHIAQKVFVKVPVDSFYLEYDTKRAGTFEPLAHLPKNKTVVLGLISSKFAEPMEQIPDLEARIHDAAKIMAQGSGTSQEEALQRICCSPQCGFASHEEGNAIDEAGMRKKLQLVADLAKKVWGST